MRRVGVTLDVASFNAAISACEKAGKTQAAVSLLEEMRREDVPPDEISLNPTHEIRRLSASGSWYNVSGPCMVLTNLQVHLPQSRSGDQALGTMYLGPAWCILICKYTSPNL